MIVLMQELHPGLYSMQLSSSAAPQQVHVQHLPWQDPLLRCIAGFQRPEPLITPPKSAPNYNDEQHSQQLSTSLQAAAATPADDVADSVAAQASIAATKLNAVL